MDTTKYIISNLSVDYNFCLCLGFADNLVDPVDWLWTLIFMSLTLRLQYSTFCEKYAVFKQKIVM